MECRFSYLEVLRFKVLIKSASRLPKVDMFGTCDCFVEARVVRGDPRKVAQFEYTPGTPCLWSSKSAVVNNNLDPKWNQEFEALVPIDAHCFLQMILWDSNSPLPDVALCHSVMELSEVAAAKPGGSPTEHKLKFSQLPGVDLPGDIKKTQLKVELSFNIVVDKSK